MLVAAGTSQKITDENEAQGTSDSEAKKSSFIRTRSPGSDGRWQLAHDPDGFSPRPTRASSSLLRGQPSALRRQRRQGDGVGEDGLSHITKRSRAVARSIRLPRRIATRRGVV